MPGTATIPMDTFRDPRKVSKSIRNFLNPLAQSGIRDERQDQHDLWSRSNMDLNAFHVERAFLINYSVPAAP